MEELPELCDRIVSGEKLSPSELERDWRSGHTSNCQFSVEIATPGSDLGCRHLKAFDDRSARRPISVRSSPP